MSTTDPARRDDVSQDPVRSGRPSRNFEAPEIGGETVRLPLWRRKPLLIVGFAILTVFILLAVFGPLFVADPRVIDTTNTYRPPSSEFWFGTDKFGRDVFARAVHAARLDISIGIAVAIAAMVVGSTIGVVSGYFGGWIDEALMRITDVVLAFPGFVLALVLVAAIGNTIPNVVVAVTVAYIPYFIRLTRAQVLAERELEYVDGAKLAGNGRWRIAFRHVLPNSMGSSVVQAALVAGWAILTVAGLAFLGVGIRPPTSEWGVMVAEGAPDIMTGQWWTALFAGGMIVLAAMAFQFIGDDLGAEEV
jgi:peptide/nickel transport system permease protein